jgi:hypothetical protein
MRASHGPLQPGTVERGDPELLLEQACFAEHGRGRRSVERVPQDRQSPEPDLVSR